MYSFSGQYEDEATPKQQLINMNSRNMVVRCVWASIIKLLTQTFLEVLKYLGRDERKAVHQLNNEFWGRVRRSFGGLKRDVFGSINYSYCSVVCYYFCVVNK